MPHIQYIYSAEKSHRPAASLPGPGSDKLCPLPNVIVKVRGENPRREWTNPQEPTQAIK